MSRRRWSIAAIVVLGLVLSAAALWWQLPSIARWIVVRQIETVTGRRVTVERFDLVLERGRLEVRGFRLADREPGPPLAEIDRLDARFAPGALLRGRLDVREAIIDGLRVRIVRTERGELNIADLLRRPPPREAPPAVNIGRLALTAGVLTVEDRAIATARTWRAEAITVEASALSTVDAAPRGALRLAAAVAGAPLSIELTELGLVPLRARARVAAKGVDVAVAQIAAPAEALLVLGSAALTADLTAALEAGGAFRLDGRGSLDGIAIVRRGSDAHVATVPSLAFAVDGAGVHGQAAQIERLEVTGTATVIDQRSRPPLPIPIDRLRLTVEATDGDATSVRVRFVGARQGGGEVDVQGTARLAPIEANLRARVTRVDLAVWDALIPLPGRLDGVAESDLTVAVTTSPAGLGVRARGRAALTRLSLSDGGRPLIAAQELELAGIDAEWPRLRIERIRAVRPTVAAERDAEGRLSLMALVPPAGPPSPAAAARAAAAPAGSGLAVEIGEVVVSEGTLTLDDASVAPPARLRISPFGLTAHDVGWPGPRAAKVEMKVALPVTGTFDATGTVSLDPVKLDLRARLAGAALGPYQAYVPVAARIRGRLDADVTVTGALAPRIDLAVKGTAAVRDLTIGERERPLITVARMEMTGLDYRWPTTVAVDRFRVERSWAMLERRADGTLPLAALFRPLPEAAAPASSVGAAPAQAVAFDVAVRESVLEGGALTIVDGAVSPAARVEITGARLEAHDFTWPARRPVALQLQASTPGGGSVRVQGQLGVGSRSLEGKLVASGVDVAPIRPYLPVRAGIAGKAGAELTVKVALEPLALAAQGKADLQGLAVADGTRPLVTAARIEATGIDYAWPATAKIDRIEIQKPTAVLERRADGTLPLSALLVPPGAAARETAGQVVAPRPSPAAIDVAVREVVVTGGAAVVIDGAVSPPARVELGDLGLTAKDVTWPARGPASIQLRAALPSGGSASAEGRLGPDARSLDLKVALRDVDLALTRAYLARRGTVAGKAGGDFDVKVALEPLAITARGAASVSNLSVSDDRQALVKVPRVEATGLVYAWPAKVSLDRLRAQGAWALIERGRDGGLTLLTLLTPAPPPSPSGTRGGAAPGAAAAGLVPEVSVRETLIEAAGAAIVDSAVSPATRVEISGARLVVRDLTWPAKGAATVELLVPMPGGGKVEASGQLHLDATRVDVTLALQRADVAVAQPYLPLRGRVGGKVDGQLTIKGSLTPLAVSATGSLIVADGLLADGQRTLATVKRLELAGLNADWPRRVSVERIGVHQPWALVERNADGSIPLLSVLEPPVPAASASAGPPAPPPTASPKPVIEIGAVVVEDGFVRFVDSTTQPRFVEEVSGLASTARRLGTAPDARSPFTLGGRLSGSAPFQLEGRVGPVMGPLVLEVKGKLSDLALTHLNPYASQYLGWSARRGVLGLTFDYRIADDNLDARNDVVIGQPEIVPSRRGEAVRERIGVPVDTLVSLLKDSRGEVKMSVPVTGRVSARQFDFGDAVWEGIRKTVINVLALPVSWVGKIFYTEDARIDTIQIWPVTFEPGTTVVRRDIAAHAARLATFLKDAPGVTLTLKPVVTAEDLAALARAAVRRRIDAVAVESGSPVPEVAARLFAERAPGRPAPATVDAIVEELAKAEDLPDGAVAALAKSRVDVLRRELAARGFVDPSRLHVSEGAVPVEASGPGRVEFEIAS